VRQWFRMYARFVTDPDVEELSFEDQRHFVFLLCLKCDGLLDKEFPDNEKRERAIARRLGLQGEAFTNAKQRLIESRLIDADWQPRSWESLQFESDSDPTGADRQRRYREKKRHALRDVTVTETVTPLEQNRTEQNRERDVTVTVTRERRSRRAPKGFSPDLEYASAQLPDIDAEAEARKFRDWEFKTPRSDWEAVWRTWIANCKERGQYARKEAMRWT
jgi:hypothetical protein